MSSYKILRNYDNKVIIRERKEIGVEVADTTRCHSLVPKICCLLFDRSPRRSLGLRISIVPLMFALLAVNIAIEGVDVIDGHRFVLIVTGRFHSLHIDTESSAGVQEDLAHAIQAFVPL